MRPRIGITLDSEDAGGYASLPWYALRRNYCDAILAAGGLPLPLPHHPRITSYNVCYTKLLRCGNGSGSPPAARIASQ